MDHRRIVLFLQGPTSGFWRELGAAFEAAGHKVLKVNFSLGDALYWRRLDAINYRGRVSRWKPYLARLVARHGVTDILYYADRLPYHIAAAELAREIGIRAIAIENGYLRPDWLTVERGGMGVFSHFPADPAAIRAIAATAPEPDLVVRYYHGFIGEMANEYTYRLTSYVWWIFFPFYQSGQYYDPIVELFYGFRHYLKEKIRDTAARAVVETLVSGEVPYHVVALQLQGDHQIRSNSPYAHLATMIGDVIASFAAHAAPDGKLVFKQHPHDNNRENWESIVGEAAARAGIAERVVFIDGGDLGRLLSHASGCVIVNSTVGLYSIRAGCPTKLLGVAIYDMPGLTHQGTLDSFWRAPEPVDQALAADFVRAIAATIQVKGSFYDPVGRAAAAGEIVGRVAGGQVNEPGGFVPTPPRIAVAQRLGMTVAG